MSKLLLAASNPFPISKHRREQFFYSGCWQGILANTQTGTWKLVSKNTAALHSRSLPLCYSNLVLISGTALGREAACVHTAEQEVIKQSSVPWNTVALNMLLGTSASEHANALSTGEEHKVRSSSGHPDSSRFTPQPPQFRHPVRVGITVHTELFLEFWAGMRTFKFMYLLLSALQPCVTWDYGCKGCRTSETMGCFPPIK